MPDKKKYFIEACVTSLEEAIHAEQSGADRLEICARLETEGMTPDLILVEEIKRHVKIPLRIMIRETEVGFEVNDEIMVSMISAIGRLKDLNIDGFVLGVMKNGEIDREAMSILLKKSSPLPITFHKAIDQSVRKWEDVNWLNENPSIDTILTSGGKENVEDGIKEVLTMKKAFQGKVMAGGKITTGILPALHKKLELNWYHGRNIV